MTVSPQTVGVVIPHYDDERRLRWVLDAVARQRYPLDLVHVVVADDGSPRPPELPALPIRCDVVRQEDRGFRAGAARNLGAAAADGELLVFLDGDTIPEPGYLAALSAAAPDGGAGWLAVGRREHVDLAGYEGRQVRAWIEGSDRPHARLLTAPAWLREGYARTDNLRDAGEQDFRLVISAVLAVRRRLFQATGGFDQSMVGYGGEDWEFAWRCWLLGADFVHVPDAVAWHDGADAGDRDGDRSAARTVKDAESLALAARITLPSTRGRGLVWDRPDVAVEVTGRHTDAQLLVTVMSVLRHTDAGVWLTAYERVPEALAGDPRVHAGGPPDEVCRRARRQVRLHALLVLEADLARVDVVAVPGVLTVCGTRDLARGTTCPLTQALPDWATPVSDEPLERTFGRWRHDG